MCNPEPIFIAKDILLAAPPKILKDRHIRLTLAQGPKGKNIAALGWNWAERVAQLELEQGSRINIAYRLRQNENPNFSGLELEIAGIELA